jgi:hypothetical protein
VTKYLTSWFSIEVLQYGCVDAVGDPLDAMIVKAVVVNLECRGTLLSQDSPNQLWRKVEFEIYAILLS